MPLPATMLKRKPVATLRWPMAICVSPKVQTSATAMVTPITKSARRRMK